MKIKHLFSIAAMLLVVGITSCEKDEDPGVAPTVLSTDPIASATNSAVNGKISATFDVAMDPSSFTNETFTLKQGTTAVAGTVTYTGTTASFTPTAMLAPNAVFTARLSTGVKNASGMALATAFSWSFTSGATPDIIAPTVTVTDPANGAVGVTLTHLVIVTFSEPMDAATLTGSTVLLKAGTTAVAGSVTKTGTTATFTPTASLSASTLYTGTITTGAKDMAGNAIAVEKTFSFTTGLAPDITLPTVTATDPLNNATGVALNKVISVTFSEAMAPATIVAANFTVKQGTTAVAGAVAYSGTTATFTPANILANSTSYTATITTGAKDVAGNALAANTVWSFTTIAGSSNNLPVVNLGAAGNYVILAKTGISNISTSAVTGDLGLSPAATSYITGFSLTNATGFATSAQITGKIFAADMADPTPTNLTTAVENMITAYNDAAGRQNPDFLELAVGNIGGRTLAPGLYKWTNTVTLQSDVTISGGPNDVWIFQTTGDLTMSNAVRLTLIGGAQAKNIFWQVAGTVTLGTTSHFEGIVLSMTEITIQTGASFKGRALAQTAVVLDGNAVTPSN
jgi:hypothetical protein